MYGPDGMGSFVEKVQVLPFGAGGVLIGARGREAESWQGLMYVHEMRERSIYVRLLLEVWDSC